MSSCCPPTSDSTPKPTEATPAYKKIDWILWGPILAVTASLAIHLSGLPITWAPAQRFIQGVVEFSVTMGPSIVLAVLAMGFLNLVPQQWFFQILGKGGTINGIIRAMLAGVLLDLCSHGILMVGAKLYREGASFGQLLAFLITSPWNSFSMMLLLAALVGWKWVAIFLVGSAVVGLLAGIFADLVFKIQPPATKKSLENTSSDSSCCDSSPDSSSGSTSEHTQASALNTFLQGMQESTMVLRWVLLGLVMAAGVRAVFSPDTFSHTFAPTFAGLSLTLLATSIIEVCSEGSIPIAADLLNHAQAPGNAFVFLMAGVATDLTEMIIIRDLTGSWRYALWLPALTVPWVLLIGMWLNSGSLF